MSVHLQQLNRLMRKAGYVPMPARGGGSHHAWVNLQTGHRVRQAHHGKHTTFSPRALKRLEGEIAERVAVGVAVREALRQNTQDILAHQARKKRAPPAIDRVTRTTAEKREKAHDLFTLSPIAR
jgi:hypothetical protein